MNMRELLNAWMYGKTIQYRSRNPSIALAEGWRDLGPFDDKLAGLSLSPGNEYRLKPEPREFFMLVRANYVSSIGAPVAHVYEYRADLLADIEQYELKGEIIHVREVMPE